MRRAYFTTFARSEKTKEVDRGVVMGIRDDRLDG